MKMKMKKRIVVPLISAIIAMIAFAMYTKAIKNSEIIIGMSPTFQPFGYVSGKEGDEVIGFDVEIIKEISKDLNIPFRIQVIDFNELFTEIQKNNIHFAINSISITEERKKIVDFSIPYYSTAVVALVRADDTTFEGIDTKEALGENKRLASRTGTTCMNAAVKIAAGKTVAANSSWKILVNKLLNKEVDAVLVDFDIALALKAEFGGLTTLPIEFETDYYGVAVAKGNTKLREAINSTIQRLIDSGEYDRLVYDHITNYKDQ